MGLGVCFAPHSLYSVSSTSRAGLSGLLNVDVSWAPFCGLCMAKKRSETVLGKTYLVLSSNTI